MDSLISIIVPVYNIAEYLERCIGSILKQTYSNIEVIAVDDGSKDSSWMVLEELQKRDSRLHIIHQENGGVTRARLAGVKAAGGEWVGFVDGDDLIERDMYERLLKNAITYDSDISHCGYQMIFPDRIDYFYNTGRIVLQDKETGLKDLIEGSFIEPGLCNKLFHKSLLQDLFHEMDFSIKHNEDLLMNYYLFKQSKRSVFEDFCPYHYILREGSATQGKSNFQNMTDPAKVMKIIMDDCQHASCRPSIIRRYAGILITLTEHKQTREKAKIELKNILPETKKCGKKVWLQSFGAEYFPRVYKRIHVIYGILKGNNGKYKLK